MDVTGWRFKVPLKAAFKGISHREGLLFEGPGGWGEFSPLPGAAALATASAKRCALWFATERWPAPAVDRIRVNAVIPDVVPSRAYHLARICGCTSIKVKVGDPGDEARVEAVRDAAGQNAELRVDANGAWSIEEAVRAIGSLSRYGLALVEQPCASIEDVAAVRRRVDVPIAVDECVTTVADAQSVRRQAAADAIVIKLQSVGGPDEAAQIIDAAGLDPIVSSPLETSVGIAAGVAFAASLGETRWAHGLGTALLLASDVVEDRFIPEQGWLAVRSPQVDRESLLRDEEINS